MSPTPTPAARSRSSPASDIVGRCTSGGFGWRVGKSLALGMVRAGACGDSARELDVSILGSRHRAMVIEESPFDPGKRSACGPERRGCRKINAATSCK